MQFSPFRVFTCNSISKLVIYFSLYLLFGLSRNYSQNQISFSYTGKVQRWNVPSCVQKIKIEVWGAQGGGSVSCANSGMVLQADGGLGGYASGELNVTSGQLFYIVVGGQGKTGANGTYEGGYNGGGDGGMYAAGGGGATDIRTILHDLDSRLIVGGGGGGGNTGCPDVGTGGNGGGTIGEVGMALYHFTPGGGGGTQVMGGNAGYSLGVGLPGFSGTWGQGGGAGIGNDQFHVAGGGGGWYGGGSAYAAGGGGGSSNIWGVSSGSTTQGLGAGNGLVRITLINDVSCPSCALTCKSSINISMPIEECYRTVTPDEVLAHDSECTTFGYNLTITYPFGTNKLFGIDVDRSHLNQTLIYSVSNPNGNTCWGTLKVEDKSAPVTGCHGTQSISCYQLNKLLDIKTQVIDNCSEKNTAIVENLVFTEFGCNDVSRLGYIYRTVRSSDVWGNSSVCSDTLFISKDSIEEIQKPDLISLSCRVTCKTPNVSSNPNLPDYQEITFSKDPTNKFYPSPELLFSLQTNDTFNASRPCLPAYLNVVPYLYDSVLVWDEGEYIKQWQKVNQFSSKNQYCKIEVVYKDEIIPMCDDGAGFKIRREWLINDWCTNKEKIFIQYIEVLDKGGPVLALSNGGTDLRDDRLYYRASVDPHSCYATVSLKSLVVWDCSPTIKQSFRVVYTDPENASKVIIQSGSLPGTVKLPANQGTYGVRCHDITSTLSDGCFNSTKKVIKVCVIDDQPPEVIAHEKIQATVDPASCWSRIYARDLDNGSRDNCCNVLHFAIARMDSIEVARKYVYDAIIAQCGWNDYKNSQEYYDFYIEDYISSYIFKDYIDLSACEEYRIVLRVWEACGIPRFDPHIWPCSEHLWYMYNVGYPRSHYRADHNLNYGFSKNANYSKFIAPKNCNWRYPLIFCDPLLKDWFAVAGLDDYNPYYEGSGAAELCNFSFYWPRLGAKSGSFSNIDLAPGNTCSRMLWKDAMVMVSVTDKTLPVAEKPVDLFWYCDNVGTSKSNRYEYASCDDESFKDDNAIDGVCSDINNNPYYEIECLKENDGILIDSKDRLGIPFGWYGCNVYAPTHSEEHGSSKPCASNEGSWAPIYCHSWLCLDANDHGGKINAATAFYTPRLKNGSPTYSLVDSNAFWMWDNCTIDVKSLIIKDTSIIDKCDNGWIKRTWTVKDKCGNSISTEQKIVTKHRSDFEAIFPQDVRTTCAGNLDFSPAKIGKPIVTDDECELSGISYSDETFDIVPDACYKIVRTWRIIDWCIYDPNKHYKDQDIIVDDRWVADTSHRPCVYRNLKDNGDGYMTYTQIIKVYDTIAPSIRCLDTSFCIDDAACTNSNIDIKMNATDNCTLSELLEYRWELDENPSASDLALKAYNKSSIDKKSSNGVKSFIWKASISRSLVHFIVRDKCDNEDTCSFTLTVRDCKKPTPYCLTGIVTVLMPSSGIITVWAKDLNSGSYDNCTPGTDLKFSFGGDKDVVKKDFTCIDLKGGRSTSIPLNVYVWDAAGLSDFCQSQVILQDGSGNICPDSFLVSKPDISDRINRTSIVDNGAVISQPPFVKGIQNDLGFQLLQNRPNPFNTSSWIEFYLPKAYGYNLSMVDISGRVILTKKGSGQKGLNQVQVLRSELQAAGIYYYTLESKGYKATKKMIIIN